MEKQLIYEALTAINREVEAIKKDQTNQQQGFKYRGIDQVMNELHDLFAKHEVLITSEVLNYNREERVNPTTGKSLIWTIIDYKFNFTAKDGSSISSTAVGEAMDSGDKGSNKCISVALKYVLFNMFLIPTAEMKDPDAETHELAPKTTATTQPKAATKTPEQKPVPPQPEPFDKAKYEAEIKAIKTKAEMGEYWKKNKAMQSCPEFTELVNTYGKKLTK